jgi:hypothetical protein
VPDKDFQVVGDVAARLPLVSKSLSFICARFRDCEYSSVSFDDSQQHAILKPTEPKMPA